MIFFYPLFRKPSHRYNFDAQTFTQANRICSVKFLNRSLPIFPIAHHKIKPGRMVYVKVRIQFVEKLSGIAIVKLLYKYHIGTMQVCIDSNQSIIKIINNTEETIHYTPQLAIGIVDIRSLGYYNVSKSKMFFDKRGNEEMIEFLPHHTEYPSFTPTTITRPKK